MSEGKKREGAWLALADARFHEYVGRHGDLDPSNCPLCASTVGLMVAFARATPPPEAAEGRDETAATRALAVIKKLNDDALKQAARVRALEAALGEIVEEAGSRFEAHAKVEAMEIIACRALLAKATP